MQEDRTSRAFYGSPSLETFCLDTQCGNLLTVKIPLGVPLVTSTAMTNLPINRAELLKNITCPYCGVALDERNDTKEHVIGRNFVPRGSLDGQWNLIVRACGACNEAKSYLENDISAITLAGRLWFGAGDGETSIHAEAQRKAKNSFSRKTGKPVIQSQENLGVQFQFGPGATFGVNMVSPPQLDTDRVFELARLQLMAFFYFITFDSVAQKGGFWLGGFHPLSMTHHQDWGNSLHRDFMRAVVTWEPRWIGCTANGFFKSIIRRHPHEQCWSWALEWNQNYRVIGFLGEREPAQAIVNTLAWPEMKIMPIHGDASWRYREEVLLAEEDDLLFSHGT